MFGKRKEPEVYLSSENSFLGKFKYFIDDFSPSAKVVVGGVVLLFFGLGLYGQKKGYNYHLNAKQAEINQLEKAVEMYQAENFNLTSNLNRYMAEANLQGAKNFEINLNTFLKNLKTYSTKSDSARDFYAYLNGRKNQIIAKENNPVYLRDEVLKEYTYNPIFRSDMNRFGKRLDPRFLSEYFPLLPPTPSEIKIEPNK